MMFPAVLNTISIHTAPVKYSSMLDCPFDFAFSIAWAMKTIQRSQRCCSCSRFLRSGVELRAYPYEHDVGVASADSIHSSLSPSRTLPVICIYAHPIQVSSLTDIILFAGQEVLWAATSTSMILILAHHRQYVRLYLHTSDSTQDYCASRCMRFI